MIRKRLIQRVALPVALAAAAVGGTVAVAVPAAATATTVGGEQGTVRVTNFNDCPDGFVCVWGDTNYTGRFVGQIGSLDRPDIESFMNDLTSSVWNRSPYQICFYENTNYGGDLLLVAFPGNSFANVGDRANDRISSWKRC